MDTTVKTWRNILKEFNGEPKTYYHGTNNMFNEFSLHNNKMYKEIDIPVWFFTQDLNYAKTYGSLIYEVNLNIKNTFDTSKKEHLNIFIDYLKSEGKDEDDIDVLFDEQFYSGIPYWTCEDAFYCALQNKFDSILIAEELESEVDSIGVFDKDNIQIVNKYKL